MTFIELTRIDSNGAKKSVLLDTENVARVVEKKEKDTNLYNEDNEVVETKEGAVYYIVEPKVGHNTKLDSENYEKLKKALTK
jgi:hypothetical protein